MAAVNAFITSTLASQNLQYTQTTPLPFSYTQNGPADVTLTATVPTTVMQIIHVNQMQVSATSHCYDTPSSINPTSTGNVVSEGFEATTCGGSVCWTLPNGTTTPWGASGSISATNTFTSTVAYIGSSGAQWYIMGYCLEVDTVGTILGTVPQGSHSAELDCDNGQGTAGNSSISTKAYLAAGNYELRYNYASRIDYPDYDPVYLCGSSASDLSWANDTNATAGTTANVLRTNQINAYLDLNTNGVPPTHMTIDGTQTLAGSNLIDMCVYSDGWIQRSVRIKVTTAGYYWLSFAADGTNDSFGGQLDNIMLCSGSCTGSLQDNFPSTWLSANNGGSNVLLFEDSFESPVYSQDSGSSIPHTKGANLVNSTGTTMSCSAYSVQALPGWPCQSATASSATWAPGYTEGWATGPANEVVQILSGADQGSQYVSITGWNGLSTGITTINRAVSRPFLLDPGYYQLSYDYISDVDFSPSGNYGTFCYAAPSSGYVFSASDPNLTGTIRFSSSKTGDGTTNIVGAYMANGQLVSTPINSGATLGGTTSYNNPDGTVTTTPKVPPDNVSWSNYNASASNPVIDVCLYADSFRWISRSVPVMITKPGIYWLTFSANGAVSSGDGNGGGIDDVKLTALGSPYMSNPPTTSLTTIPVPSPQPGAVTSFTGFEIVSDPLTPPAALQ